MKHCTSFAAPEFRAQAQKTLTEALRTARNRSLKPFPRLTVSEWADQYRRLSVESSATPGRWRTSRAAYQRGILDAIGDPLTHTIVVRSSAQVGKTEIILNAIGFFVAQDASSMLVVMPTLEMAQSFSKDRLAPMVRDTPAIHSLIVSEDRQDTLLHKAFPGGRLIVAGANSPASLASRPLRIVLLDEVDRYPASAGAEGDPITLAKARTKTFWNSKTVLTSTPTVKGFSRIDQAYEESDQRRYHVPCPHCGEFQVLAWANVRWEADRPTTAKYLCNSCGTLWNDAERMRAVEAGEWRAERPFTAVAGFALSELYSPWARLPAVAQAFLDAKHSRSQERMRAFINTSLGESYEEDSERLDETGLAARVEEWEGVPDGVLVVTAGVDVQDDRVEVEVVGWGQHEESWSLAYFVIYGDPSAATLWNDLERRLTDHKPHAVAIDSGGHYTQAVYRFTADKLRRRWYAIKGVAGQGRPVWPKRATKVAKGRSHLFLIGVDSAKDQIHAHLKLRTLGPAYCHFPRDRDDQYFAGLASEVVVTRYSKGFPIREYKRRSGVRNEPLDCRVYAYAALCSMNINWSRLARHKPRREIAQASSPTTSLTPTAKMQQAKAQRFPPPLRRNWATSWKD
jgi:phage terminase large subunit GpA-like protein